MLKRFSISIRWRGYRWHLQGLARSSFDLLAGLLDYLPHGCAVTIRREP